MSKEFTLRIAMGSPLVSFNGLNQFDLSLPNGWYANNNSMALEALYIYYSWRNISTSLNNNQFQYIFNGTTYTVTIPSGIYQYSDINSYLQQVMQSNGHYLVDNNGVNVYYLSLQANAVAYSVLIQATPIPSSLPTNWTNPNNISLSGESPQFVFSGGFSTVIGFTPGTYPSNPSTTPYAFNSQNIPKITTVTAINVNCNNLALNPLTNNQVLTTFTPQQTGATPGSLIAYVPYNIDYVPVANTTHTSIQVSLTDQDGNPIQIYDTTGVVFILKVL